MTIQLEVGKTYKTRDGRHYRITKHVPHDREYPYGGKCVRGGYLGEKGAFTSTGRWYADSSGESRYDLLSEVTTEKPVDNETTRPVVQSTVTSDGSTASYYELPERAAQLQDLISHRNMNAQVGEIFRACYRYGMVSHSPQIRDIKKIIFYAQAELKRLENLS